MMHGHGKSRNFSEKQRYFKWRVTYRVTFLARRRPPMRYFGRADSLGPTGMHQRGSARATDGVLLFRILRGWASAGREVGMRRRARRCGCARPALIEPERASNTVQDLPTGFIAMPSDGLLYQAHSHGVGCSGPYPRR